MAWGVMLRRGGVRASMYLHCAHACCYQRRCREGGEGRDGRGSRGVQLHGCVCAAAHLHRGGAFVACTPILALQTDDAKYEI